MISSRHSKIPYLLLNNRECVVKCPSYSYTDCEPCLAFARHRRRLILIRFAARLSAAAMSCKSCSVFPDAVTCDSTGALTCRTAGYVVVQKQCVAGTAFALYQGYFSSTPAGSWTERLLGMLLYAYRAILCRD